MRKMTTAALPTRIWTSPTIRRAALALALAIAGQAHAQPNPSPNPSPSLSPSPAPLTVGLHWLSGHSRGGFEAITPGLYLRTAEGATVGAYRNSYHRASYYVGVTQDLHVSPSVTASVTLGVICGYREGQLGGGPSRTLVPHPLVAPSILIHDEAGTGARFTFLPPAHPKSSGVLHLGLEWKLP